MYNMITKVIALVTCIASPASSQYILTPAGREAAGYPLVHHAASSSSASAFFGSPVYENSITPGVQQPRSDLRGLMFDKIRRYRSPELFDHWKKLSFPPRSGYEFGPVIYGRPEDAYSCKNRRFGMHFGVPVPQLPRGISLAGTPMVYGYRATHTDHPRYSRGLSFPNFQQSVFYPVTFPVGYPSSSYYPAHPYGDSLLRTVPLGGITPSGLASKDNTWELLGSYRNHLNAYEHNQIHPTFDSNTTSTQNTGRYYYPVVRAHSDFGNDQINANLSSTSSHAVQSTGKSNSVTKLRLLPKGTVNNHAAIVRYDVKDLNSGPLRVQFDWKPSHSSIDYRINDEDQHHQNEKQISPLGKGSRNSASSRDVVGKPCHSTPGYNNTQRDSFPTRYDLLQVFEREPGHVSGPERQEFHSSGEEYLGDSHSRPFVNEHADSIASASSSPFSSLRSLISSSSRKRHKPQ